MQKQIGHLTKHVPPGQNKPFLAVLGLRGGAVVVFPVEGAVVTLDAAVFAVPELVKGFDVAVVGRDDVEAG